jgi:hypothetical protein
MTDLVSQTQAMFQFSGYTIRVTLSAGDIFDQLLPFDRVYLLMKRVDHTMKHKSLDLASYLALGTISKLAALFEKERMLLNSVCQFA